MAKKLQLELPDDIYDDLVNLAQIIKQLPEQMAAELITTMIGAITGKAIQIPGGKNVGISPYSSGSTGGRKKVGGSARAGPTPNKEVANLVYQLKVTLKESKPPIWRRIQVPGNITLLKLHRVLQAVMGWEDYHLHQFVVDGVFYGTRDPDFQVSGMETVNERGVRLYQIALDVGSRFIYEYDFGDSWYHQIVVEKLLPPEAGASARYPTCIAGKRACPPEDVGGVWGYESFLEAIRDPAHPEHEELLGWAGGSFDPEEFDLEDVNDALKRVR